MVLIKVGLHITVSGIVFSALFQDNFDLVSDDTLFVSFFDKYFICILFRQILKDLRIIFVFIEN